MYPASVTYTGGKTGEGAAELLHDESHATVSLICRCCLPSFNSVVPFTLNLDSVFSFIVIFYLKILF